MGLPGPRPNCHWPDLIKESIPYWIVLSRFTPVQIWQMVLIHHRPHLQSLAIHFSVAALSSRNRIASLIFLTHNTATTGNPIDFHAQPLLGTIPYVRVTNITMKPRTTIWIGALVLTMVAAGLVLRLVAEVKNWPVASTSVPPHADESLTTLNQISEAVAIAKKGDKRVLLEFGSRGCTWCHLLNKLFEKDELIGTELQNDYILVTVDVSDGNNKQVDDQYGTPRQNSLPFSVILDSDGKVLLAQNIAFADERALSNGIPRIDPGKVLDLLKKYSFKKPTLPLGS
jgi:hypothetical protein